MLGTLEYQPAKVLAEAACASGIPNHLIPLLLGKPDRKEFISRNSDTHRRRFHCCTYDNTPVNGFSATGKLRNVSDDSVPRLIGKPER
jgi:hypothetical protein